MCLCCALQVKPNDIDADSDSSDDTDDAYNSSSSSSSTASSNDKSYSIHHVHERYDRTQTASNIACEQHTQCVPTDVGHCNLVAYT